MNVNCFFFASILLEKLMTTDDSATALESQLCFGTYKLNRAFNRFYQRAFHETGLTYPKFVILRALEEFGPMNVTELSQRAGVEPNSLSPLLKKMASFDILRRERVAEDERRVVITLTDKGSFILHKARAVADEGFAKLGLDPKQVTEILEFVDQLGKRLDAVDPPKLRLD